MDLRMDNIVRHYEVKGNCRFASAGRGDWIVVCYTVQIKAA